MDRITDLLSRVPGYDGYRDKENRRETDKRIREHVSERLGNLASRIEAVATTLANQRDVMAVGPVNSAAQGVRHLQNQIATATYGYGGIYSDRNVDAAALDQIANFDRDMLERVEALDEPIKSLEAAQDDGGRSVATQAIGNAVRDLQTRFSERGRVVETGRPEMSAAVTSPLTVLDETPAQPAFPAEYHLKRGDALAIGGKNFLVDAVISVEGEQPMRLFRIDVAPDRWLVVNARFVADTTAGEIIDSGDSATANGESLAPHGSGSAPATVEGLAGSSGTQTVTYHVFGGAAAGGTFALRLAWPTATLSVVGRGIDRDDITIFGQPAR
ncbi:MAG: hypothetical protein M3Y37_08940 [Chloroflexota bacterium]|nr:hypothetical protein [Chloroflexota bacterium]